MTENIGKASNYGTQLVDFAKAANRHFLHEKDDYPRPHRLPKRELQAMAIRVPILQNFMDSGAIAVPYVFRRMNAAFTNGGSSPMSKVLYREALLPIRKTCGSHPVLAEELIVLPDDPAVVDAFEQQRAVSRQRAASLLGRPDAVSHEDEKDHPEVRQILFLQMGFYDALLESGALRVRYAVAQYVALTQSAGGDVPPVNEGVVQAALIPIVELCSEGLEAISELSERTWQ